MISLPIPPVIKQYWRLALIGIVTLAVIYFGYSYMESHKPGASGVMNYKMTISVRTPEGLKSASVVRQIGIRALSPSERAQSVQPYESRVVKGEALVLNLGNHGMLFATMRDVDDQNYGHDVVFRAFPHDAEYDTNEMVHFYENLNSSTAKVELMPNDYPMLLFFKDISDPKSAQPVLLMDSSGGRNPVYSVRRDRFEDFYGTGVFLNSISIEATREPVTEGLLEHYLPVWKDVNLKFAQPADFKQ